MNKLLCGLLVVSLMCGVAYGEVKGKAGDIRLLVLGNSITRHGPSAAVDWHVNWGMAASDIEKDFSHILQRYFKDLNGGVLPEAKIDNIATFERGYKTMDIAATMKPFIDFKPTVMVLAINENVAGLKGEEDEKAYYEALVKMLKLFKDNGNPKLYVRSSFWPNEPKDRVLRKACEWYGGTYVDISALAKDEKNYARSEREFKHAGVANHPGDAGMKNIADMIWKAVLKNNQ